MNYYVVVRFGDGTRMVTVHHTLSDAASTVREWMDKDTRGMSVSVVSGDQKELLHDPRIIRGL